jgi:chromosome segregation ATPase
MPGTRQTPAASDELVETMTDEPVARISPRRARIDGPHPVTSDLPPADDLAVPLLEIVEEAPADLIAAITGESPEARRELLEMQANQLSEHLRERLREVDRREAQLNARVAQMESDLRSSRVWLREQEHEFAEREAELRRQLDDSRLLGEGQTAAVDRTDAESDPTTLAERESQVQLKENELRERRFEIERQGAALRHAQQLWDQEKSRQEAELARERERLARQFREQSAERDAQLRSAEENVAEANRQLVQDRAELAADRRAWEERRQAQAEALDERIKTAEDELADRRQRLDARTDWIEMQKNGLEQVRGEIAALHRQSLEMRLAAEQLWAQVSGRLTPAEVSQSIANLRLKLADHYRLEEESLSAKKQELVELGQRLTEQHRELAQLQAGLKGWAAARQAEIEEQAARLVRREEELESQEDGLRHSRAEWQTQRQAYEQQLRELRAALREPAAAA